MPLVRINRNPSSRQLAVFGLTWLGFFGTWGCLSWLRAHHGSAEILWALAITVPSAGLLIPGFLRIVYVSLSYVVYPMGFASSYLILMLVYFLIVSPIGLTMRLVGYDPLSRRLNPKAKSYWRTRRAATPPEDYFRQS
jgi:hypothetical protein